MEILNRLLQPPSNKYDQYYKQGAFELTWTLGNDTLVPVALILNELITNSLKHAFKDVKEGNIDISISWEKDNTYFRLNYKDSGQWKSNQRPASFGLELIATLTEQLDGKVECTFDDGTKYDFLLKDMS